MARNVLSWNAALDIGLDPRKYTYVAGEIPLGEFEAVLDFKIWAKKILAIGCYFTHAVTEQKFQLTVYCKAGVGLYRVEECSIDFTECPIGRLYRVKVIADQKKKIVFKGAEII